ncbi:hypothetical protein O6H91_11G051600 [Diphasiastrum complanatum]|uniref:Uncharacterized protein n=1 Tax=Diphasiastrum complanatum TaxID=34168 RepID=A0ACC2C998_DIPCM|nr:hypothetical protein O6H91_11G051600 [Diphasiastrum complanatum]
MVDAGMVSQGSSSIRQRHSLLEMLHPSYESSSLNSSFPTTGSSSENSEVSPVLSEHLPTAQERLSAAEDADASPDVSVYADGYAAVVITALKLVLCFLVMLVNATVWGVIMLLLLPLPCARIKQSNLFGHITGRMLMWILGNPLTVEGVENANTKAIYISNHASLLDIVLVMWLIPTGTVGIAKKEIIWYPFFGQLYVLANHLRIDRSNPAAAIKSMNQVANDVVQKDLSLIIFPEGTRSSSGRLLHFKKGCVHLAIRTRRPIVPIILTGTHLAWRKSSLNFRPTPLKVTILPPINTDDWDIDKIDHYLEMLHALFLKHLPESQKPLPKLTKQVHSS